MPPIDRTFVKMVAIKRVVTGALSLACGIATTVMVGMLDRRPPKFTFVGIAIFLGGGAWALRDGVRLLRDLRATDPGRK